MWPPEVHDYNDKFTRVLSSIKRRHDPVVTTVAQGILEFKRDRQSAHIDRSIQTFLDRFYMSRIGASLLPSRRLGVGLELTRTVRATGIRVLIGQHIALNRLEPHEVRRSSSFCLFRVETDFQIALTGLRCAPRPLCPPRVLPRAHTLTLALPSLPQSASSARAPTCTRLRARRSRTRRTYARSTTACSRARPSSSSAPRTSTSCTCRAIS